MMRKDIDQWIKICKPNVTADIFRKVTRSRDKGNNYIILINDYFATFVDTVNLPAITAADVMHIEVGFYGLELLLVAWGPKIQLQQSTIDWRVYSTENREGELDLPY